MKCDRCGREIDGSEFARHWEFCKGAALREEKAEYSASERAALVREHEANLQRELQRKRRAEREERKRERKQEFKRRCQEEARRKHTPVAHGTVTWKSARGSGRATAGVDFEVVVPTGDGVCSDRACPCPETVIPRGKGYLYISEGVVDFRRDAPTEQDAIEKLSRAEAALEQSSGAMALVNPRCAVPVLMCEQGARLRGLDLETAAADARHWWETGLVPLRATPLKANGSNPH